MRSNHRCGRSRTCRRDADTDRNCNYRRRRRPCWNEQADPADLLLLLSRTRDVDTPVKTSKVKIKRIQLDTTWLFVFLKWRGKKNLNFMTFFHVFQLRCYVWFRYPIYQMCAMQRRTTSTFDDRRVREYDEIWMRHVYLWNWHSGYTWATPCRKALVWVRRRARGRWVRTRWQSFDARRAPLRRQHPLDNTKDNLTYSG